MASSSTANVSSLQSADEQRVARGLFQDAFQRFLRHRTGMIGAVIVLVLLFMGLLGPTLAPYNPRTMSPADQYAPPSLEHPLGADDFGRDTLSRIMHGAQVSVLVGLISVGLAASVGSTLGMVAGYTKTRILDEVIMRTMDVLMAFPTILLALAIMAVLGRGVFNAMLAIGIVYIPIFARIARGAVLAVKNQDFIEAAHALGATDFHILTRHIFPNILPPLIVETSLSLSFAILAEAALSFFSLGTQAPDSSWGLMLREGRNFFYQSAWMGIFPGLAIMLSVMGFNFLGDGLRDVLDPRMKR
jgi:peptide/nickel transport system permease protein